MVAEVHAAQETLQRRPGVSQIPGKARHTTVFAVAGLCVVGIFGAGGCDTDSTDSSSATTAAPAMTAPAMTAPAITAPAMSAPAGPAGNLVGRGCAAYAQQVPSGPGSAEGTTHDPAAVAISSNPMLKTFTSALSGQFNPEVNLAKALNTGASLTVFAPTDDAFAKIDPATIGNLKTNPDLLTKVLNYHIVGDQLSPTQVVGEHTTLEGAAVAGSGSGANMTINNAGLVCGGIRRSTQPCT
jgi:uncharacterized surface protein with fasciclin (FAS1) repeats